MARCKSRLVEFQTKKYKEALSFVERVQRGEIIGEDTPEQGIVNEQDQERIT